MKNRKVFLILVIVILLIILFYIIFNKNKVEYFAASNCALNNKTIKNVPFKLLNFNLIYGNKNGFDRNITPDVNDAIKNLKNKTFNNIEDFISQLNNEFDKKKTITAECHPNNRDYSNSQCQKDSTNYENTTYISKFDPLEISCKKSDDYEIKGATSISKCTCESDRFKAGDKLTANIYDERSTYKKNAYLHIKILSSIPPPLTPPKKA